MIVCLVFIVSFLLLENLVSLFSIPSIVDIKLGTTQYIPGEVKAEKKERQDEKCKKSTSAKLGMRICGMMVCKRIKKMMSDYIIFVCLLMLFMHIARLFQMIIHVTSYFCSLIEKIKHNMFISINMLE